MKYILLTLSTFTLTQNIHPMLARARCVQHTPFSTRHTSYRRPSIAKAHIAVPVVPNSFGKNTAIYNEMLKKRNRAIGNIGLAGTCILAVGMDLIPRYDFQGEIPFFLGGWLGMTMSIVNGFEAYDLWKQYNKQHQIQK